MIKTSLLALFTFPSCFVNVTSRPEKYTIKPERKEIAAVSIDLTRHDDFQGPRKLEVSPVQVNSTSRLSRRLFRRRSDAFDVFRWDRKSSTRWI